MVNYGLERILRKAVMNHFRHSGGLYINVLMKATQIYSKPDLILGVNLYLILP